MQSLVADGVFETAVCTDDRIGVLYENLEPVRVLADFEVDPETGPAAYRVVRQAGVAVESRIAPGVITD